MTATKLMITCPETGEPIFTGIAIDPASFAGAEMKNNAASCPKCGGTHIWNMEDTFWEGESHN